LSEKLSLKLRGADRGFFSLRKTRRGKADRAGDLDWRLIFYDGGVVWQTFFLVRFRFVMLRRLGFFFVRVENLKD
jgi:hypothetical protein